MAKAPIPHSSEQLPRPDRFTVICTAPISSLLPRLKRLEIDTGNMKKEGTRKGGHNNKAAQFKREKNWNHLHAVGQRRAFSK